METRNGGNFDFLTNFSNDDFEVKPCMLKTEDKCEDFGEVCCSTLTERAMFNNYIDEHGLPKELKFDFVVGFDLNGRETPF